MCANFYSYKDLMGDARCLLELPAILNSGQRLHRAHVITTTSGRNAIVLQLDVAAKIGLPKKKV